MIRPLRWLVFLGLVGAGAAWVLTGPDALAEDTLAGETADAARGQLVFAAAGCAACHSAPEPQADDDGAPILSGGRRFASDFGTFIAPNISTDATHGIGGWSDMEIANAVMRGVSPAGAHYYPAFPYDAYAKASPADIADLIAYLRTLPAAAQPSPAHEVGFPFNIRRAVGMWKLLFRSDEWVLTGDLTPEQERGRYLVEAQGHCGECHTPRNLLGGLQRDAWLGGAAHPSGEGRIPDITPGRLRWSQIEIADYLSSGFTPEFDTAGGEMALVVRNTAQLPAEDRMAIAAYLKAVPPLE